MLGCHSPLLGTWPVASLTLDLDRGCAGPTLTGSSKHHNTPKFTLKEGDVRGFFRKRTRQTNVDAILVDSHASVAMYVC